MRKYIATLAALVFGAGLAVVGVQSPGRGGNLGMPGRKQLRLHRK